MSRRFSVRDISFCVFNSVMNTCRYSPRCATLQSLSMGQTHPVVEQLESRDLMSGVPVLHSYPGASHTIFLDFDGHITSGTEWNLKFTTLHSPPFDLDGKPYEDGVPTFNAEEQRRIMSIWQRMAEDFRPFDVDVTTVDPTLNDPNVFTTGGRAQRIVFTSKFDAGIHGTGLRWYEPETLGAATDSWFAPRDTPAWVFSTHPLAGEIGSHEAGHTLGLQHDGEITESQSYIEYRGEHGTGETRWSPIMGQGNGLSQWSRGEYPGATNTQLDIGILTQALGRRPDDYTEITPLTKPGNPHVDVEGIIGDRRDSDTFSFEVLHPATRVSLSITPWENGPNLDIAASLFGQSTGQIISSNDTAANPVNALASTIELTLAPGIYFLQIDGTGKQPVPGDPGYSDYGSLGYYRILGSIGDVGLPGDINSDGTISAADIDTLYSELGTRPSSRLDLNQDGAVNSGDVDFLVREIIATEYGDFDLNGRVDFADFLILSKNFQRNEVDWLHGDASGDKQVDLTDFLLLSDHFGAWY